MADANEIEAPEIEALDLAALLASRICHDMISPITALTVGLDTLDEDDNEETKAAALDLIRLSIGNASAKLQFARLAFGASGSAGAEIDLGEAEKVARGYMENEKPELSWEAPRALMPKNRVKLLLNLLLLAGGAIPRGGTIRVTVSGTVEAPEFRLHCAGQAARVPPAFEKLVPGNIAGERIDAHAIQPYYTGLLARAAGMAVTATLDGADVVIAAKPAAA